MNLPNRRPVKVDDLTPPRWTDRYPALLGHIVVNLNRRTVQQIIDLTVDHVERMNAADRRRREKAAAARKARLRR